MRRLCTGYDGAFPEIRRSVILYEYPFNERIRTYLRLEHLFRRLGELVPRDHPVDHHYALATIFEVMDVGARADLKSDVSIRSRVGIPGGTCELDLPAYFAWQHREPGLRRADLQRWASTLGPLAESIHMLLKLLRDSGSRQKVMATGGQLQQNLPQGRTFQLLRLRIDSSLHLVPEISGNRLMVSVRLMNEEAGDRLQPSNADAQFELTLCS